MGVAEAWAWKPSRHHSGCPPFTMLLELFWEPLLCVFCCHIALGHYSLVEILKLASTIQLAYSLLFGYYYPILNSYTLGGKTPQAD